MLKKEKNPARGPFALVRLGYACNNNCIFCHSSEGRSGGFELDTDGAREKIVLAAAHGAGGIVFSGGEPTIREDILDLMAFARELDLGTGLITNGRMFCYKDFANRAADIGIDYVLVSLHGHDKETHNILTGVDSFKQTLAGLAVVSKIASRVTVNTVLMRRNASGLARTARILENFAPIHFKISLPEPRGAVIDHPDNVLPPYDAARIVSDFLMEFRPGRGVTVGIDGLSPCLLEDYLSLNDDFYTHGIYLVSEPEESEFFPPTHGRRGFTRNCIYCSMYHLCPGIYVEYIERFQNLILRPLRREVSNTVLFEPVGELKEGVSCESIRSPDPARKLAVKKDRRLEIYETREIQTEVPELMKLKYDTEQVYVAKSDIEERHGSPAHLQKMQLTKECRKCRKVRMCPGIYVKPRRQPFTELKGRIKELLDMLEGRVCEVGCGDGTYARQIKSMIRSGRITHYLGIDPGLPDESRVGMDGSYELKKGLFEEYKCEGAKFDFVALFRSYHHLGDLRRAGIVLSAITGPGARVIIMEDSRFVEMKESSTRSGECPSGGFEHIRNHAARDAANVLERFGFEPEILWEPECFSAGCWAVVAVREK